MASIARVAYTRMHSEFIVDRFSCSYQSATGFVSALNRLDCLRVLPVCPCVRM